MATQSNDQQDNLQSRFAQQIRAKLSFNPLGGFDIAGANLGRLQKAAESFGWTDPRFVTAEQAAALGWSIKQRAERVDLEVRSPADGSVEKFTVFNAANVKGMPSIASMLSMPSNEIASMQAQAATHGLPDEISIGPARQLPLEQQEKSEDGPKVAPIPLQPGFRRLVGRAAAPYMHDPEQSLSYYAELEDAKGNRSKTWGLDIERSLDAAGVSLGDPIALIRDGSRAVEVDERQQDGTVIRKTVDRVNWETARQITPQVGPTGPDIGDTDPVAPRGSRPVPQAADKGPQRFSALAPYWHNGLHNVEGLALAQTLNDTIKLQKLAEDKEAITRLLSAHPKARVLGVNIVPEEQYLNDPFLRADLARPSKLLDGALVRDKEGAYRPAAGGRPVVQDQNDSIVLKNKDTTAYRGAMELAKAKGWSAIELKGKPAMMANAWLEAKLMGLDVVNYSPSEKDLANYHARVAEESKLKAEQATGRAAQQAPEFVEVRPYVDAEGLQKTATVTYTVSSQGGPDAQFGTPKDAARAFANLAPAGTPVVVRSVMRADGQVRDDVIAGVGRGTNIGAVALSMEPIVDREFDEALAEVIAEEKSVAAVVSTGQHVGPIVAVQDGRVAQKVGRDPNKLVWHDLASLRGPIPAIGEMADIEYSKGLGVSKQVDLQREQLGGGRGIGR